MIFKIFSTNKANKMIEKSKNFEIVLRYKHLKSAQVLPLLLHLRCSPQDRVNIFLALPYTFICYYPISYKTCFKKYTVPARVLTNGFHFHCEAVCKTAPSRIDHLPPGFLLQ